MTTTSHIKYHQLINFNPSYRTKMNTKICILIMLINLLLLSCVLMFQQPGKYFNDEIITEDYHTIVNMSFTFQNTPSTICASSLFVVAVHSGTQNFEQRLALRQTWGQKLDRTSNNHNCSRIVFMLGATSNGTIQQKIDDECKTHDDIVQGDFMDSYHNLTYKHLMLFKYVLYHSPDVEYVLKVDDDAFVNMPHFEDFMQLYADKYSNSTDILCNTVLKAQVFRKGKWAVSKEVYAANRYPTYCSGYSVIYPRKTVEALYLAAQEDEQVFWIDDVYVTGILAEKLGIRHKSTRPLTLHKQIQAKILKDKKYKTRLGPFLFGDYDVNASNMRRLWQFFKENKPRLTILDYLN